ncbi:PAS-domain containing protein [Sulfitobacter sp. 20_GPM-1509m]|uniref:PAS-domain containing protein n=1 Tax=Sulfitobacter sp. 20_GPM-1509m TaxID=1380367 RepID=UPI00068561F5|nr:PAS-domain containing protein [Sulfitobacter sp. 20_GPM-1509m]
MLPPSAEDRHVPRNDDQNRALTTAGLNLIAQALSIYDSDLRLSVCNVAFQQMFRLPDALVQPGATFEDTIRHIATQGEYGPIDDIEAFVAERVSTARAFEPHYMERTRANGRTISVEGAPLPQGGWVTVYTDITRTKDQEHMLRARSDALSDMVLSRSEELAATNRQLSATVAALEEAKRELTEMEARTRLVTEMMPAHIAHVDETGHYTYTNRRLSSILPDRPSDLMGLHISDALGPTNYALIAPHLQAAYEGRPSVFEFTDGPSARRIRAAFTPDTAQGAYILSMDVTEETQARVALQQNRKRALAAQMTSGLAHDFSNLLTIILGLQSKLERMDDLPEGAAPLIEGTRAAARRGGHLLDGIANATAARVLRPGPVEVAGLLADVATLASPTLPAGQTLRVDCTLPPGPLLLDTGIVQDSLLNLILNARDACGAKGTITLTAAAIGETWVEFTVTDTGPGFSDEALHKACDPFFTTKGGEGSGLGLPMVYDMTKTAGGHLGLRNTLTGAEVRLRLPLNRPAPVTGGMVLLVEDRDDLRALYRDMLMDLGHSVIEAASVDEATALTAALPDIGLILSDIRLGAASGIDLVDRLKDAGLPIILMTSLPVTDPMHRAALTRAPVLQKPFSADDLAALLMPQAAQ